VSSKASLRALQINSIEQPTLESAEERRCLVIHPAIAHNADVADTKTIPGLCNRESD
jgi:hypothetical protein